jgi:Kef-type K+ transport system membrane component KefB
VKADVMAILAVDLVVIVVVARALGALARRLGQPAVIGEILGGVLLGPTLFDGAVTNALFPADVRPTLTTIAMVGVCLFMFLVGLELDPELLRGHSRIATTVALSAMVLPFGLGVLLALYLAGNHPTGNHLVFVLFMGVAMAVTAFPVLARILTDKGLLHTPIGGLALACAAIGDVLAWSVLAVVAALAGGAAEPWRVLLIVPYALFLLRVVRPLLNRLAARNPAPGRLGGAAVLVAVPAGVLLSAELTGWMGLHGIFGAFLLGVAMPREGAAALRARVLPWVRRGCAYLLLPVFFVVAGSAVDLSFVGGVALGELGLILLVAIGGKFGGAFLGARASGIRPRHATVLAILINTRGLTELIVLTVGLQLAVLDRELYSLMVVMALVTTAMAGVVLRLVYPPELIRRDQDRTAGIPRSRPTPKESAS